MTQKNPETVYKERIKSLDLRIKQLKKKDTLLSILKLILFFAGLFLLFKFFGEKPVLALIIFGSFFILFVFAAVLHETVLEKINQCKTLKTINENEINILSHRFPSAQDFGLSDISGITGADFKNSEHPYTSDLDIFGDKSLFHYINRCVTSMGRKCLALRLQTPADINQIKQGQEAVKELAPKLDFRQDLQAYGMDIDDTSQKLESLRLLFNEPLFIMNKKPFVYFIYLLPLFTIALFIAMAFNLSLAVPLGFVFFQVAVNRKTGKKVSYFYKLTSKNAKILKTYSRILRRIEQEPFESQKLQELKANLSVKRGTASRAIKRLSTLVEWFDIRASGMIHFMVNNILLWDLHCVYRIEKWKQETASVADQWFDVIGGAEALAAFANVYYNNPYWSFPRIHEQGFRLKGLDVGHPLIPQTERVCNDMSLEQEGNILMVTGPNMAGKSTFLRTVGVNAVLALAGGPVCAKGFEISPMKLFTSMQTSDSLDKHLSLFYAELQRLKMVLDGISGQDKKRQPVFFMIDEMLKGTNALDRQKGSIVLIKQLAKRRANGIVATHDLELAKLEKEEETIFNYHFDGYIKEDKLLFDYKLKEGICKSFNAVVLMRKIGIDV